MGRDRIRHCARRPGPAVWRLTRGASEVWILGTAARCRGRWTGTSNTVADLLDGARAVLLPPRADFNLVDIAWFLLRHGSELSLPRGQKLEDGLPSDLRARFSRRATAAIGADAGDYRTDIPIRAAVRLGQDFLKKADLEYREPRSDGGEPGRRSKRIPTAPVTRFDVMDAVRDLLKLTPAISSAPACPRRWKTSPGACAHARRAARAWAVGDIRTVKDQLQRIPAVRLRHRPGGDGSAISMPATPPRRCAR